jgi:transcriptional regulator with XRE-family HTH domain
MAHWTDRSLDDFLYRIAADFVAQLETKIQSESLNKTELAQRLRISKGRVSQLLNNPGNLSLKTIIRFARALGMKIAIVAYDDQDPQNEHGPIDSEIFRICWANSGRPADFWSLAEPSRVAAGSVMPSLPQDSLIRCEPLAHSEWTSGRPPSNFLEIEQNGATVHPVRGQSDRCLLSPHDIPELVAYATTRPSNHHFGDTLH